jgi:hypothetical protein
MDTCSHEKKEDSGALANPINAIDSSTATDPLPPPVSAGRLIYDCKLTDTHSHGNGKTEYVQAASPLPTKEEVLCLKLAVYLVCVIAVVLLCDAREFEFQVARMDMCGAAFVHNFRSVMLGHIVLGAVRWLHPRNSFCNILIDVSTYILLIFSMQYPSLTGFTPSMALWAHVASSFVGQILFSTKRSNLHQAIEQHNMTAVAQVLVVPMILGFVVQLPACLVFATRFPGVCVSWWDYRQLQKDQAAVPQQPHPGVPMQRRSALGSSLPRSKEPQPQGQRQKTRLSQQMWLCSIIWVIGIVVMIGIEADERRASHAVGSHYRYHHQLRCQLEAASPLLEQSTRCGIRTHGPGPEPVPSLPLPQYTIDVATMESNATVSSGFIDFASHYYSASTIRFLATAGCVLWVLYVSNLLCV